MVGVLIYLLKLEEFIDYFVVGFIGICEVFNIERNWI